MTGEELCTKLYQRMTAEQEHYRRYCQEKYAKKFASSVKMGSADNSGIPQSRLQVLYVQVFLVALLGAGHVAQPSADQHEGRIAVGKAPTTRVRRRISRLSRSMTLLVRMRVQCS